MSAVLDIVGRPIALSRCVVPLIEQRIESLEDKRLILRFHRLTHSFSPDAADRVCDLKKHYWADLPPSTGYDAPVINDALSDERKTIVCAISSGLPTRLSGTVAVRPAFLSSVPVKRFSIPVSIGPGATRLTRTPDGAASSAADLVSPSTACLLAEYREAPAAPVRP